MLPGIPFPNKFPAASGRVSREEIRSVGYAAADYDAMTERFDPKTLSAGWNTVDGEDVFFIPNPALGLWIARDRFTEEAPLG